MKKCASLIAFGAVLVSGAGAQSDHNNIDSGRPLRFDDAFSIAFRERALEFGLSLDTFRRKAANYGFKAEYKVGFAKNQDIGITFDPSYDGSERRFDAGNVEIAYFNAFRREINNAPALAHRIELGLPTGRGARGVDAKFRAIATRALRQYDKVHLNLDASVATNPGPGERNVALGVILGYTNPLGYPRKFDQTMVAELALQQSRRIGEGYVGSVGIGLRRQISPQSVFDIGIASDLFSTKGAERSPFRLALGWSIGF
jgi:hypothetical protein